VSEYFRMRREMTSICSLSLIFIVPLFICASFYYCCFSIYIGILPTYLPIDPYTFIVPLSICASIYYYCFSIYLYIYLLLLLLYLYTCLPIYISTITTSLSIHLSTTVHSPISLFKPQTKTPKKKHPIHISTRTRTLLPPYKESGSPLQDRVNPPPR
jgi:hypothetical protein